MPFYCLDTFKGICGEIPGRNSKVTVTRGAAARASEDFNLDTLDKIMDFVFDGEFSMKHFDCTRDLIKNHTGVPHLKVDSYKFIVDSKPCYFAFFFNNTTNKWVIKSLHADDSPQFVNNVMASKLAGLL
ncbi:MAG: hypothetical protein CME62_12445 [Halobacteriovoraceae bacterium]|nr:hypothetical protein [Halobacteriovoraceae bacterium]|tara:strand:- start:2261 stop:2647 length:387 start_codon:yes stop_codon:yes gene_type:complete